MPRRLSRPAGRSWSTTLRLTKPNADGRTRSFRANPRSRFSSRRSSPAMSVFGRISLQNLDRDERVQRGRRSTADDARLEPERRARERPPGRRDAPARGRAGDVNEVGQAAASLLDLDKLIELVGDQMAATFKADIAYVALYDRATGLIEFPYHIENGKREQQPPLPLGEGLTSRIIQKRQPLLLNQAEHFERGRQLQSLGRPPRHIWACRSWSATTRSARSASRASPGGPLRRRRRAPADDDRGERRHGDPERPACTASRSAERPRWRRWPRSGARSRPRSS